ncbi:MAG: radical SAM protein [Spirochaetota bacterium]|nr:radical SAM protein [Spirochaetota bacterium]
MIINKTKSYCFDCETDHDAVYKVSDGRVLFEIDCPAGPEEVLISTDPDLFIKIREKNTVQLGTLFHNSISQTNLIEITDNCNFDCNICYAQSTIQDNPKYVSVDQVLALARTLKDRNITQVTITGGEPTVHPDVTEIISRLAKMGFNITMPTNGLLLGKDPTLAKRLRESKLKLCHIQFDSLKRDTHMKIRANDTINYKIEAFNNAKDAGLEFTAIATIIKDNLPEVADIVEFCSGWSPYINAVLLLTAMPAGRFHLEEKDLVNREEIINQLIDSKKIKGLNSDHFWPIPRFKPLWLNVHPDCAAILFLAVINKELRPLDDFMDIKKLYSRLDKSPFKMSYLRGALSFILSFLRSVRPGHFFSVLKMIYGTFRKKGRHAILLVVVESFVRKGCNDRQRIDHCATMHVMPDGELVPGCVYNHPDPRRHKITRNIQKTIS